MSEFRLSREAETELDAIWIRIARESDSIDIATRVVESIAERFWLLARYPYMGRRRDEDLRPGLRSFPADEYVIIHRIEEDGAVLILHVVHASRERGVWAEWSVQEFRALPFDHADLNGQAADYSLHRVGSGPVLTSCREGDATGRPVRSNLSECPATACPTAPQFRVQWRQRSRRRPACRPGTRSQPRRRCRRSDRNSDGRQ